MLVEFAFAISLPVWLCVEEFLRLREPRPRVWSETKRIVQPAQPKVA